MTSSYGPVEACLYDYGAMGKDYASETFALVVEVLQRNPGAQTLLDVACGTGRHLAFLRSRFSVEGLDASPDMAALARAHLDDVTIHEGDMRTFALGRRFDVVTCLFSSIGYMRTEEELDQAVATMAAHLTPGGVLAVEPWIFPEDWVDGLVTSRAAETPDGPVMRMDTSWREGRTSQLLCHYLDGRNGRVEHSSELHDLTLFDRADYEAAYRHAGLDVEFQHPGLSGRGLFVGSAPW